MPVPRQHATQALQCVRCAQYFVLIWKATTRGHRTQHPDTNLRHHDDVGALKRAQSQVPLKDADISISDGSQHPSVPKEVQMP